MTITSIAMSFLVALACLAESSIQMPASQDGDHADPESKVVSRHHPLVVAHRGASAEAPENTMAAFQLGWQQQADAIEGDFFLTKDRQIVAIHDPNTLRTAGVDWDVRTKTLAELLTLDVGRWKDDAFAGQRIPTLEQVIDSIPEGKRLFLEIKDSPRIVPALKQRLAPDPEQLKVSSQRITIIAFDAEVIAACKREMPTIPAMWLTSFKQNETTKAIRPDIDQIIATLTRIKADGLDCQAASHIDQAFVDRLRESGFEFHVWTVDDPAVANRFIELGVDSITTNVPAMIRDACQIPLASTVEQ